MTFRHRFAGHLGVRAPDRPLLLHLAGATDPLRQIELLAELGFTGVFDNYLMLRPHDVQSAIGAAAARLGLEMGSFVHDPLAWNRPTWSADNRDSRAALQQALSDSLDAAARSGSRTINCITGCDPAVGKSAQLAAMADNLAWAADKAAARGVLLCVEVTHPEFAPGLLLESVDDALALLERVDHPYVRLNLDSGHLALHGLDVPAAIRAAAGRIGMVQLADVPGRVEPGAGELDWAEMFRALRDVGHDGLLELELEPAGEGEAGERALLSRLSQLE